MLTDYINAAMRRAKYKILDEDEGFWGEIPGLQGVWANADTLEECRDELQSALEEWIVFGLQFNDPFPEVDGLTIERLQTQEARAV